MNKKSKMNLILILLIVIALITIVVSFPRNKPVDITYPSISVPAEYRAQYDQINGMLDTKLVEWKPVDPKPVLFGVYDVFSSDNMFTKTNTDIDMKYLDVLLETNAKIIVLYIRPASYFAQKTRYNAIISKIRDSGRELFIGARFGDEKMTFVQYDQASKDYTAKIIGVIKPDYYGIVIEPATMEDKYGFDISTDEWVQLVDRQSKLSKQLSPNTKTAVGGHKLELDFLKASANVESLDIIGFNIYDAAGIVDGVDSYAGKGDVIGAAIDLVNSKGKETWMLETGRNAAPNLLSEQPFMVIPDAKWLQLMSYYAQKHNMKVVIPFYTGKFVTYSTNVKIGLAALNNRERTELFRIFKELIRK